ncbi:hypothetical protein K1719_028802 [Acacia pycnantha]|nr:hypothetical protein K1719_028802 [Acacia pycnantha]
MFISSLPDFGRYNRTRNMRLIQICAICVWLFISLLSYTSRDCDFPAIFNFGDSNSDTGGLSVAFSQAGPPYASPSTPQVVVVGNMDRNYVTEIVPSSHYSPHFSR